MEVTFPSGDPRPPSALRFSQDHNKGRICGRCLTDRNEVGVADFRIAIDWAAEADLGRHR
jgi:hypothetical protein